MTKVVEKKVRCAKCGVESNQMIVYSVSFLFGTKEDNEKLMNHQQTCPNCNYKAADISIKEENNQSDSKVAGVSEIAKEKLLKCYALYKEGKFIECTTLLEELKKQMFSYSEEIDPFWINSAGDLFSGITFEILKHNKIEDITFINILNFKVDGKENIDNITEYVSLLDKDSYSYISLSSIGSAPVETKKSIISVFKQNMRQYALLETKK